MFDRFDNAMWWDATLRAVSGCTKVSPGCDNCWAESETKMRQHNPSQKIKDQWAGDFSGNIHLLPDNIEKVLKARTPKAWAVWNDLFHPGVPNEYRDRVIGAFAVAQKQLGIILTKRPSQMGGYFCDMKRQVSIAGAVSAAVGTSIDLGRFWGEAGWPLKNVWLGTTTEDQQWADERVPELLKCPAAVRFLSIEPLLGPLYLLKYFADIECSECDWLGFIDNDTPEGGLQKVYKGEGDWQDCWDEYDPDDEGIWICPKCKAHDSHMPYVPLHNPFGDDPRIDWVIVGGESKSGAIGRECKIEWVRSIVAQCKAAGVPVFVKQLHIDGKLVKDMKKFPEDLRVREHPVFSL